MEVKYDDLSFSSLVQLQRNMWNDFMRESLAWTSLLRNVFSNLLWEGEQGVRTAFWWIKQQFWWAMRTEIFRVIEFHSLNPEHISLKPYIWELKVYIQLNSSYVIKKSSWSIKLVKLQNFENVALVVKTIALRNICKTRLPSGCECQSSFIRNKNLVWNHSPIFQRAVLTSINYKRNV